MCYLHTLYHACGCYGRKTIYGEPCIRAVMGAGLSNGCWDTIDMGVDNDDKPCPRCQKGSKARANSTSGSFDSGYASDDDSATTLVDSRRGSAALSASTATSKVSREAVEKVSCTDNNARAPLLTPRAAPYASRAAVKRIRSAHSFGSVAPVSRATSADHARSLMSCLPSDIPGIRRNASGVGLAVDWQPKVVREGMENMHWRAYHDRYA